MSLIYSSIRAIAILRSICMLTRISMAKRVLSGATNEVIESSSSSLSILASSQNPPTGRTNFFNTLGIVEMYIEKELNVAECMALAFQRCWFTTLSCGTYSITVFREHLYLGTAKMRVARVKELESILVYAKGKSMCKRRSSTISASFN